MCSFSEHARVNLQSTEAVVRFHRRQIDSGFPLSGMPRLSSPFERPCRLQIIRGPRLIGDSRLRSSVA
jgi:hypothetical protein